MRITANYRDQNSTFSGIAAESEQQFHLGTDKSAERIKGALITGNYFEVFGVKAALGRLIEPSEAEVEGANPVAVISERLWRDQFGAEAHALGQTFSLNSHPYTVIGVAAEFKGSSPLDEKTDVWIPVTMWRHGNPWMVKIGVDWLNSRSSDFVALYGTAQTGRDSGSGAGRSFCNCGKAWTDLPPNKREAWGASFRKPRFVAC